MNRIKTLLAASALVALPGLAAAQNFPEELIKRGEYTATASDCVACHTAHGGKPMAGGLVMASPVGDIVATNITPSKQFGIGHYTEQQFADALRKGVRADGANLYPAMPYTAYAKLSDDDVHALYAYFMQGVAPVDEPVAETSLPFPMNIRLSMKAWNLLFHDDQPLAADAEHSAAWNRGHYLVEGPAHCGTCHTPRGLLMQEQNDRFLAGAQVGPWYAPNITPHRNSGIGSWTADELVQYLKTGHLEGKAQAAGSMAEAISHSFQHLRDDDLQAIANYVMSVPAVASADGFSGEQSRFNQGQAGNQLSDLRGVESADDAMGARIYSGSCASCHGYNGQGTTDAYYPSLFSNSALTGVNTSNLLATILYGVDRKTARGHVFMPPFGDQPNALDRLSNDEIAALANYLVRQYGDGKQTVSADDVQTIRQGGPASNLLLLARLGMLAGVLVALGLIIWLLARKRRAARQRSA